MNLFAYGTLMWPEVLESVIGRRLEGCPAVLDGFVRLRVKGEHYPAVVSRDGGVVEGIVYSGLSVEDFRHLDRFEGEEYERMGRPVDGVEAQVYVLGRNFRHMAEDAIWGAGTAEF